MSNLSVTRINEDGELEKLCLQCGEFWPATDEFFFRQVGRGPLRSPCKACIEETRRVTNASKPCCVLGCNNPRYGWRYSRCIEHLREQNRRKSIKRVRR